METNELLQAFDEAFKQGFITDLHTAECNQNCEECPASEACTQLSAGDYKTFVKNYKALREARDA